MSFFTFFFLLICVETFVALLLYIIVWRTLFNRIVSVFLFLGTIALGVWSIPWATNTWQSVQTHQVASSSSEWVFPTPLAVWSFTPTKERLDYLAYLAEGTTPLQARFQPLVTQAEKSQRLRATTSEAEQEWIKIWEAFDNRIKEGYPQALYICEYKQNDIAYVLPCQVSTDEQLNKPQLLTQRYVSEPNEAIMRHLQGLLSLPKDSFPLTTDPSVTLPEGYEVQYRTWTDEPTWLQMYLGIED